jgi:hypothetical protein
LSHETEILFNGIISAGLISEYFLLVIPFHFEKQVIGRLSAKRLGRRLKKAELYFFLGLNEA